MPVSDVSIINMALSHVGHTIFINDRTEASGEVPNLHYDLAVDTVLQEHEWQFATAYDTLGLVAEDPNHDWYYAYRYPVDRLTIRRIVTTLGRQDPNPPPFLIGSDDTGALIYTSEENAKVETTKRITNTALFPPLFSEALSWWLAFVVAPGLAKDPAIAERCLVMYDRVLSRAEVADGNQSQAHPALESEAIRARD